MAPTKKKSTPLERSKKPAPRGRPKKLLDPFAAFHDEILQLVIKPIVISIIQNGVESIDELIYIIQSQYHCTMPNATIEQWINACDLQLQTRVIISNMTIEESHTDPRIAELLNTTDSEPLDPQITEGLTPPAVRGPGGGPSGPLPFGGGSPGMIPVDMAQNFTHEQGSYE